MRFWHLCTVTLSRGLGWLLNLRFPLTSFQFWARIKNSSRLPGCWKVSEFNRLPPPQTCRAVIVSSAIWKWTRSSESEPLKRTRVSHFRALSLEPMKRRGSQKRSEKRQTHWHFSKGGGLVSFYPSRRAILPSSFKFEVQRGDVAHLYVSCFHACLKLLEKEDTKYFIFTQSPASDL